MISPTDILAHITNGRTEAETARALSLSHTLAGTEDMIREMMQAAPPVFTERGNTADLADLQTMRDMLDGDDWPPTPLGLLEVLKRADEADELDRDFAKALAETAAVRAERDRLAAEVTALRAQVADRDRLAGDLSIVTAELARIDRAIAPLWAGDRGSAIGERVEAVVKAAHVRAETIDGLYDKIRQRDAQVAALTPGPWVRLGDTAPNIGETVLMWSGVPDTPTWMQVFHGMAAQSVPADYLWRRISAGLLDVPAPTVAPTNAQPEGAC